MVMKKSIMGKNLRQTILKSMTRYIAIVAIIALGTGIFVGLRTTKSDMIATGQKYMDQQNMFDLRLLNTYGWGDAQLEAIRRLDGVVDAQGVISLDALGKLGDTEGVYKLYSLPDTVNQVYLLGGRMPQSPDECLADGHHATDAILGKTFTLSAENTEDVLESVSCRTYTVVGYVNTPLYMDISRGNTALGSGTVQAFVYLPEESFLLDYYTEIDITIPGNHTVYQAAFDSEMDGAADRLKLLLEPLANERMEYVRAEGEKAYADGLREYENGLADYEKGRREVLTQLNDALTELVQGERELAENRTVLEDGEKQIQEGQTLLEESEAQLSQGRSALAQNKAQAFSQLAQANATLLENYKTVSENLSQINDGLLQLESGLSQLDSGIGQLESGLRQIETMLTLLDSLNNALEPSLEAARSALEKAKEQGADAQTLEKLEAVLHSLEEKQAQYIQQAQQLREDQQAYTQQLAQLRQQREELANQKTELEQAKAELTAAADAIDAGFRELQSSQTQTENLFAAAEAELEAGQIQLESARRELDKKRAELEQGKAALAEAEQTLAQGRQDYVQGKQEAEAELSDAARKLRDAQAELLDARRTLDTMQAPAVYALTRNTNVGYLALDSNSDIVQGVSVVFPAFFLLIAALVCITTMTRMVEEERTQIGTLKALGYTNREIIGKYLAYAGSAAVIGCGLGVLIGSVVFPIILWRAYGLVLTLPPKELVLTLDWPLCIAVVLVYTAVSLTVTWYCCRRNLREVPAELIRPRAPTSGKKILLERLPFWKHIRFLDKVMLRNIFRYRQRLIMMLVGVGGCTALLLTGFGIRDSIADIGENQFAEITRYDMEVRFSEEMNAADQRTFRQAMKQYAQQITFYHQSTVELDASGGTRDIILLVSGSDMEQHMDLHSGKQKLTMPGPGEALLSVGAAEDMGIKTGDTVTLRTGDLKELTVRISGIYDNYVYNYMIITPETAEHQWGEAPSLQMACLNMLPGQDVHEASARVMEMDGVMNVTVCRDLADQVTSMMSALDLVVITVLICAGLLAVTVSYNLTNINITERLREIATIKVLGFTAVESAAYVFKENLLLSAIGSAVGLLGGYGLLQFVMSQIKVNMVWLPARLCVPSYLFSVGITMLLACLVDFLLYFRLEKIDMAQALKSVE